MFFWITGSRSISLPSSVVRSPARCGTHAASSLIRVLSNGRRSGWPRAAVEPAPPAGRPALPPGTLGTAHSPRLGTPHGRPDGRPLGMMYWRDANPALTGRANVWRVPLDRGHSERRQIPTSEVSGPCLRSEDPTFTARATIGGAPRSMARGRLPGPRILPVLEG